MIYRKLAERARKQKYIYTQTHTHIHIENCDSCPLSLFRDSEAGGPCLSLCLWQGTQYTAAEACVACTFQLLLLPPLLLAFLGVVAGVWKINCTSTALPLLLAMRICHLHNVCVSVSRSMYACVYVCAEEKKAIQEKHLQIFYLRQFSFIHATAAHVVSVADFLAVAACLFDTIGQLLLPINNYH